MHIVSAVILKCFLFISLLVVFCFSFLAGFCFCNDTTFLSVTDNCTPCARGIDISINVCG